MVVATAQRASGADAAVIGIAGWLLPRMGIRDRPAAVAGQGWTRFVERHVRTDVLYVLGEQGNGCDAPAARRACRVRPKASPRDRQLLFSLYSHTQPNFTGARGRARALVWPYSRR